MSLLQMGGFGKALLVLFAFAAIVLTVKAVFGHRQAKEASGRISQATEKAETAIQVAIETETKAIAARPKLEQARQKSGIYLPPESDVPLVASYKINTEAMCHTLSIGERSGIDRIVELIEALETQLTLEIARADAWKEAYEAQVQLTTAHKNRNRRTFWKGAGTGAGVAILLMVII